MGAEFVPRAGSVSLYKADEVNLLQIRRNLMPTWTIGPERFLPDRSAKTRARVAHHRHRGGSLIGSVYTVISATRSKNRCPVDLPILTYTEIFLAYNRFLSQYVISAPRSVCIVARPHILSFATECGVVARPRCSAVDGCMVKPSKL